MLLEMKHWVCSPIVALKNVSRYRLVCKTMGKDLRGACLCSGFQHFIKILHIRLKSLTNRLKPGPSFQQ
jgi:hypothetical protein